MSDDHTNTENDLKGLHTRLLRSTSVAALGKLDRAFHELEGRELKALSRPTASFMAVAPKDLAERAAEMLLEQFAQAKTDAQYDGLTGLHNVKALDTHLSNVISAYKRRHNAQYTTNSEKNHQPAVLFIDVDSFKALNDTYGHDKGDVLLKNIADALMHHKRPLDFVARKGGDEFIVVLKDITPERTEANPHPEESIVNRYKDLIRDIKVDVGNGQSVACPISVGIKIIDNDDTPESAIKAADENMYADKPKGIGRGSAERLIITQNTPDTPAPPSAG